MGMGQRVNPHTLRVGVFGNFDVLTNNEFGSIDDGSRKFLREKISNVSFCSLGLNGRRIKLKRILGNHNYKKAVNKVKVLSR